MKNSSEVSGNDGKHGNDDDHKSQTSHRSHDSPPANHDRLLPPRGDYQTLLSFQKAEVIYDITFRLAH